MIRLVNDSLTSYTFATRNWIDDKLKNIVVIDRNDTLKTYLAEYYNLQNGKSFKKIEELNLNLDLVQKDWFCYDAIQWRRFDNGDADCFCFTRHVINECTFLDEGILGEVPVETITLQDPWSYSGGGGGGTVFITEPTMEEVKEQALKNQTCEEAVKETIDDYNANASTAQTEAGREFVRTRNGLESLPSSGTVATNGETFFTNPTDPSLEMRVHMHNLSNGGSQFVLPIPSYQDMKSFVLWYNYMSITFPQSNILGDLTLLTITDDSDYAFKVGDGAAMKSFANYYLNHPDPESLDMQYEREYKNRITETIAQACSPENPCSEEKLARQFKDKFIAYFKFLNGGLDMGMELYESDATDDNGCTVWDKK